MWQWAAKEILMKMYMVCEEEISLSILVPYLLSEKYLK